MVCLCALLHITRSCSISIVKANAAKEITNNIMCNPIYIGCSSSECYTLQKSCYASVSLPVYVYFTTCIA